MRRTRPLFFQGPTKTVLAVLSIILSAIVLPGAVLMPAGPIVANDAYQVATGGTLKIHAPGVLGNDSGAVEAVLETGPVHGTVELHPDGSFSYVHDGSDTSNDSFTYRAADGAAISGPATVSITIGSIGFGLSALSGHTLTLPSSLQFGPDNRLYALRKLGQINIMEIARNAPNSYDVVDEEIVTLVRTIPNHDDDGYPNSGEKNRQCTGLFVAGTAENPVIYVTSSDNRVGGGAYDPDTWLDTNSGVLSQISWIGASRNDPAGFWQKVDLVRGLPRSEENHAPNGMQLSVTGDTLFLASGGFTNAGAPSRNLAYINEYALSGAVLSIDLSALDAMPTKVDGNGIAYKYDLPTLDDPTRPNENGITDPSAPGYDGIDIDDPWGGNDGLNQAKIVPGGPVQIYSPGYRNIYDLVITETPGRAGRMYTIDNGANRGWGGHPIGEGSYPGGSAGQCTNEYDPLEPGSTTPGPNDPYVNNENGLHFIRELKPGDENYAAPGEQYYGGHPNPVRGNPAGAGLYTGDYNSDPESNTGVWRDGGDPAYPLPVDWPPVPVSEANPAECDFRNSGETDGALVNFAYSTNGLTEYTASNFFGALQGNLFAVAWNETEVYRIALNQAGDQVLNPIPRGTDVLASGFGKALLDITAQGDDDIFPGTLWVTDFSGHEIYVLEPSDYGQGVPANMAVSLRQQHFGSVQVGESILQTLPITNTSQSEAVTVSSVTLDGAHMAEFEVEFTPGTVVSPGEAASLDILFSPVSIGGKTAQMIVHHNGLNAPTRIDITGTGVDSAPARTPLFRVNAGGPAILAGTEPAWQEDQAWNGGEGDAVWGTPHPFVNAESTGDHTHGTDDPITFDVSTPLQTPAGLFQRGRWNMSDESALEWDIPIEAGSIVEVRLFLAEQFFTAPNVPGASPWPRVFDVHIDGQAPPGFEGIDLFESAGHDVGQVWSAVVESDGNLDIDFIGVSGRPVLQGIEVAEINGFYSDLHTGWNLIGLPVSPVSNDYQEVFSDAAPEFAPYSWTTKYVQEAQVQPGRGYWLSAAATRTQLYASAPVDELTLALQEGWNLVSGPACELALAGVSDPGNILVPGSLFEYRDGYASSDQFFPGVGYWIQAAVPGEISLDCAATGKQAASLASTPGLDRFGLLDITDAAGAQQRLYWGGELDAGIDVRQFAMPPVGPEGSFDVRFAGGRWLAEGETSIIRLQSSAYPLRMTLSKTPVAFGGVLYVEELIGDEIVQTHELQSGQELLLQNSAVGLLKLSTRLASEIEIPQHLVVHGNYPNPFNPRTTLVFDLPENGTVDVAVYDILGRKVLEFPASAFTAGSNRRLQLDASSLAAGLYLYRLQATMPSGVEIQTGNMMLLP